MPLALVAELVDALDSKSSFFGSVGSIPTQGTLIVRNSLFYEVADFFICFWQHIGNKSNFFF
jgi:hypothetical protein